MFAIELSSKLRSDFSQVFDSLMNNVFGSNFNHALKFCEFCLGFEIFFSVSLILLRLSLKLF